jgi:hypothetical protein
MKRNYQQNSSVPAKVSDHLTQLQKQQQIQGQARRL